MVVSGPDQLMADVDNSPSELSVRVQLGGDTVIAVHNRRVILAAQDTSDGGGSQVRHLPEKIHADLAGLGSLAVAFCVP